MLRKNLETKQTAEGYKLEAYHALYLFLVPAHRSYVYVNNRVSVSLVFHIIYVDKFCTNVCKISGIQKARKLVYNRGSQTFLVHGTLFRYAKYNGTSLM